MKKIVLNKVSLSPFVAVAFVVISVTGGLLFFHVKNGPIMALHEWFGWLFVVAGLVHALLNIRPLLAYLRQPAALLSVGVAGTLALALWGLGALHEGEHQRRGGAHGQASSSSSAIP